MDAAEKTKLEGMTEASKVARLALMAEVGTNEAWSRHLPAGTFLSRWTGIPMALRGARLRLARGEGSAQQAIKAFCLECQGYDRAAVAACDTRACPLWGHRPTSKTGGGDA